MLPTMSADSLFLMEITIRNRTSVIFAHKGTPCQVSSFLFYRNCAQFGNSALKSENEPTSTKSKLPRFKITEIPFVKWFKIVVVEVFIFS